MKRNNQSGLAVVAILGIVLVVSAVGFVPTASDRIRTTNKSLTKMTLK
jgi:hypothetical protein